MPDLHAREHHLPTDEVIRYICTALDDRECDQFSRCKPVVRTSVTLTGNQARSADVRLGGRVQEDISMPLGVPAADLVAPLLRLLLGRRQDDEDDAPLTVLIVRWQPYVLMPPDVLEALHGGG